MGGWGGTSGDQQPLWHSLQVISPLRSFTLSADRQLSASWVCSHLQLNTLTPVFCAPTSSPVSGGAQVTGPLCEEAGPTETTGGAPLCGVSFSPKYMKSNAPRLFCHSPVIAVFCSLRSLLKVSFHGEGNGNPLRYSCLGNPMDKGTFMRSQKSQTGLSD